MERTAMQQLIQHMRDYPQLSWYDKAAELLEDEREQIIIAYDEGWESAEANPSVAHGFRYFTQKYADNE